MGNILSQRPDDEWLSKFNGMTTEALKQELTDGLGMTARGLLRCAGIVYVLEQRGEDLQELKVGMMNYLRKIACGQLLPEVVVRFSGKPSLIAFIGNLPTDDQRLLASGEPVRLIVPSDGGGRTHRMADPLNMQPNQVRQVFARDHIRSDAEQNLILDSRKEKASLPVPEQVGKWKLDRETGTAKCGRYVVTLSELKAMVQILSK